MIIILYRPVWIFKKIKWCGEEPGDGGGAGRCSSDSHAGQHRLGGGTGRQKDRQKGSHHLGEKGDEAFRVFSATKAR